MSFPKTEIPRMVEVHQKIQSPKLDDYVAEIRKELRKADLRGKIKPEAEIAVTAGSRGIIHYAEILATVVDEVKKAGGRPFLIPAMGSHGGASPEGQISLLKDHGITAESVGVPIRASMEVDFIGKLKNGSPVYIDRNALKADGIVIVGRVKPHTDFKGEIESGLMKMMVIGLGKQKGAEMIHRFKSEGYHKLIPEAAKLIMENAPIILGLALIENANHEIAVVKTVEPKDVERVEKELLGKAKALLPRLPFKKIDILIVEEIGKDISGAGMDTNVVGRFWLPGEVDPQSPTIGSIVVLDLSEDTHGNAIGMGLADLTTQRLVSKIDYQSTFVNALTSGHPMCGKTPVFLPTDRDAITIALQTCGMVDSKNARVVRIRNTLRLEKLWISETLLEEVKADPKLQKTLEIVGKPREMQFDIMGSLAR